ncbi:MAG: hypothetical protein LBQ61_00085 [Spirochaetales bacterium]|nr:hypothetical protein [Spirochaetales bacterium]
MHCKGCGAVFDMPIPCRAEFDRKAEEKNGFLIDSHAISFEGLCRACRKLRGLKNVGGL